MSEVATDIESVEFALTQQLVGPTLADKAPFESLLNRSKCPILAQILAQYAHAAINRRGSHQSDAADKDSFSVSPISMLRRVRGICLQPSKN